MAVSDGMCTPVSSSPPFHRVSTINPQANAVTIRMFSDAAGLVCVVAAPIRKWGLRVFTPTPLAPLAGLEALPYAQFLMRYLGAERVEVELDAGLAWHGDWGTLVLAED